MSKSLENELNVAVEIARKAGEIMLTYFDGNQQRQVKKDGSPVTIADIKINDMVIQELKKEFPNDGVVGEEQSTTGYGLGRKWFCDPIDGTKAYTWGVPTSTFSLGLIVDGQPQLGVVYDPYLDRMYTSIKTKGSHCNGKRLSVSTTPLNEGLVAITSHIKRISSGIPYVQDIASSKTRIATFSGAVYKATLVARGKFVGFVAEDAYGHDMAAVQLIVEEAGGKVTGIAGKPLDYTKPFQGAVVTNGLVHNELLAIVNKLR